MITAKIMIKLAEVVRNIDDEYARNNIGYKVGRIIAEDNSKFNWARWQIACNTNIKVADNE